MNFSEHNITVDEPPHVINVDTPTQSLLCDTTKLKLEDSSFLEQLYSSQIEDCNNNENPKKVLKNIRMSLINQLIIGQLNINSIRNKFEDLKLIVRGNIDILIITESKLDKTFNSNQFNIYGYYPPFRADRTASGGGVMIYVRCDIPCSLINNHPYSKLIEGISLEINLRKSKWFLFGGYNPNKCTISSFTKILSSILDINSKKYDNILLLGDFNSEIHEEAMSEFCEDYNLTNLIKEPTCFKSVQNPSTIDLILTNRPRCFCNSMAIETGLSDHHKLTITALRAHFHKQSPDIIIYRDYKYFDRINFRNELTQKLKNNTISLKCYETFENIIISVINKHAPMKKKYLGLITNPL